MKVRLPQICALVFAASVALGAEIPPTLRTANGEKLVLHAHASGWQIYTCGMDAEGKPKWSLKGPEAELHDEKGKVIGHHSIGPTWKYKDGSEVTGKAVAHVDAPDPNAIPWLLLTATGHTGKGAFSSVSSIQRLNTQGGLPPVAAECDPSKGNSETRSRYTADYYFYAPAK